MAGLSRSTTGWARSSTLHGSQTRPLSDGRALEPGERVQLSARMGNPLAAGHYYVNVGLAHADEARPLAFRKNAADFVVFGTRPFAGLVELPYEAEVSAEPEREPSAEPEREPS